MLVKIKHGKKFKLTIPVAFVTFEDILEVLEDWMWVFEGIFPSWKKKIVNFGCEKNAIQGFSLGAAFELVEEVFYELRKYRGSKMVEIDTKNIYLSVELL